MATPNDEANSKFTTIYDISGIVDPTIVATQAAAGSTYRLLRTGNPKFYIKLDEGKTTNWLDISSGSSGVNLGTGAQVLKNIIYNVFQFRSIKGIGAISVVQNADEIVISSSGSSQTVDNVDCDSSVQIGDLVVYSGAILVKPSSNANSQMPYGIVGIAIAKPSATKCDILVSGQLNGIFLIPDGSPLFVGATGDFSATCPPTGNVQQLGFAVDATRFVFSPKQVIRRS